jgi:hypothetical protein
VVGRHRSRNHQPPRSGPDGQSPELSHLDVGGHAIDAGGVPTQDRRA